MQIQTFGAWTASIGSIGAGALTQSPEYSFLALPVAIASGCAWLMVLGVFLFRNRKGIFGWLYNGGRRSMVIGLCLLFGGCAMGVLGLSLIAAGPRTENNLAKKSLSPGSSAAEKIPGISGGQTNAQLTSFTIEFASRLRAFGKTMKDQQQADLNKIYEENKAIIARNDPNVAAIWAQRGRNQFDQSEARRNSFELAFKNAYWTQAIMLRDELISRLTAAGKVPTAQPILVLDMLNHGRLSGWQTLDELTVYLETMARSLPE
jgi:hypothetical protein